MTPEQAAYLAGLFDGEGSISVTRSASPRKGLQVFVAIGMTDPAALRWARELTGGLGSMRQRTTRAGNQKPIWIWSLSTQAGAKVIREILPHLIVKRQQGDLLVEFASIRSRSNTKAAASLSRQHEIREEMQRLNRRGLARG